MTRLDPNDVAQLLQLASEMRERDMLILDVVRPRVLQAMDALDAVSADEAITVTVVNVAID